MTKDLKSIVSSALPTQDIVKALEDITSGQLGNLEDEQKIRNAISSSGIIDKLVEKVQVEQEALNATKSISLDNLLKRKVSKSIKLTIIKGRALVGLNNLDEDPSSTLQLHLQFQSARFKTKKVISQVEPVFNGEVTFDLPSKDVRTIVEIQSPINLVLIHRSLNLKSQIVGVADLDWRKVLHFGRLSSLVELKDPLNPQITIGIIDLLLELLPANEDLMKIDELEFNASE